MVAVEAVSPTVDSLDAVSSNAVVEVDSGSAEIVSALDEGLNPSVDVRTVEVLCETTDESSVTTVMVTGTVVPKMNKRRTIQVFRQDICQEVKVCFIDELFRTRSEAVIDSLSSDAIESDDSHRRDKISLVIDS